MPSSSARLLSPTDPLSDCVACGHADSDLLSRCGPGKVAGYPHRKFCVCSPIHNSTTPLDSRRTLPTPESMSLHLRDFVAAHAFNFRDIIGAVVATSGIVVIGEPHLIVVELAYVNLPSPPGRAPNPARTYLFRTAYPVHISSPVVATNKKLLRRCQSTYDGMNAARERDADLVGLVPVVYRAAPVGSVECPIALDACPLFRTTYMRSLGEIRVALERAVRYVTLGVVARPAAGPVPQAMSQAMPELALGHMVRAPTVLEGAPLAAPHPGGVERQWVWRSFWRDGCETDREWMFASGTQRLALLARWVREAELGSNASSAVDTDRRKDAIWREGGGSEADGAWV